MSFRNQRKWNAVSPNANNKVPTPRVRSSRRICKT